MPYGDDLPCMNESSCQNGVLNIEQVHEIRTRTAILHSTVSKDQWLDQKDQKASSGCIILVINALRVESY